MGCVPPDLEDSVQTWHFEGVPDALFVHGTTRGYSIDPTAECVLGIVTDGAMMARRGRESYIVRRGDLTLWDASGKHTGVAYGHDCWAARAIVLPMPAVEEILRDPDLPAHPVAFDSPHVRDRALAERFLTLHRAMRNSSEALMQSDLLHDWLQHLTQGRQVERSVRRARRDPALRRACEFMRDDPSANLTLAQLSAIAHVSRHRLSRLFRTAYGCPPHQFLLAQRLRIATQWLVSGVSITEAAQRAGFSDQSHLHRHLKKSRGFTPRQFQKLRSNVQDGISEAR
jgi:AraC-like DNA-binding protein